MGKDLESGPTGAGSTLTAGGTISAWIKFGKSGSFVLRAALLAQVVPALIA